MKKEWEIRKLDDVCKIVNGSTPLRTNKEFWENGDFPWFTIDDIREQGRKITRTRQKVTKAALGQLKVLPVNTVLLCCTASLGEYAISKIELTTNQQFNGLVIKNKEILNPEFLMFYCPTLKDKLIALSGKATINFVAISKLKNLTIPLPPFSEQQRIVSILDNAFEAIDKAIANAEQNIKNAQELFDSYLQGMLEKGEEGWVEKKLGEVCKVERGSSPRPIKKYLTDSNDGVNWIKIGDTKDVEKYIFSTKEKITKEGAKKSRYVKEGDFILSNSMSYGKPYIMRTDGYIHDGWFVLRLPDFIDKDYFYYFLTSRDAQNQIISLGSGAIVKNISSDLVKKVDVFYPKSLEAQKSIVKKLDTLRAETQNLEAIYEQKFLNLEELKKSLLQKAFAGELT